MIQHNHDLEILKQMAMADGILTENEKELFRSYFQLTDKEAEDLFQSIEAELECVQSETEVINWKRKNGIDFEKCIVKMLNPQYYTLQEWTGDKFIDGRFCEANCNPDITVKSTLTNWTLNLPSNVNGEWTSSMIPYLSTLSKRGNTGFIANITSINFGRV